jgi:hypothetical protein
VAETPNADGRTPARRRGPYTRSVETAERDAEAARLRTQSLTYRQIAERMGYASTASAHDAVQRCLRDTVAEAAEDVRSMELEKLDALERTALDIIGRDRPVVSNGRVLDDIPDDGPRLAALALLLRVTESRRKLLGLDQPAKVSVDGGVRYEVVGVNAAALT